MQNIADGTQDRLQKPVTLTEFQSILICFDPAFQFTSFLLDSFQFFCRPKSFMECFEVFLIFGKSILIGIIQRALDIRIVHFDQIRDGQRFLNSVESGMA